ncbi:hypothetical protein [Denitromonas sp.]|uniref:hypothetical protein n=1 Tax=Denitromonas sp. TaxID=2734609 RepID=UPI002AFF2A8A|nr:hypothetical protein [Denitromonas sp.]
MNANQVRRWLRERGIEPPSRRAREAVSLAPSAAARFVPLALAPAAEPAPVIRLDVQRGEARLKLEWPIEVADACGAWLRQWLA